MAESEENEDENETQIQGGKCRICFKRTELFLGIFFGIWNNLSTLINARTLFLQGHSLFAALTIFFLTFPGLVTSGAFLLIHFNGANRRIARLSPLRVAFYFLLLLCFYPLLPIALCVYSLVTSRRLHIASLAKLFEGFLDDGPQFVLKLVVVVLYGIGLSVERSDLIFAFSMVTSFMALVYFGLKFNERKASCLVKLVIACPMLAAFAAARAFTLAVFLKETLGHPKEFMGGLLALSLFCLINVLALRHCGQDWIRSVVFGLCSLLIPAGYNNDAYFFQLPNQPLSRPDKVRGDDYRQQQQQQQQEQEETGRNDGIALNATLTQRRLTITSPTTDVNGPTTNSSQDQDKVKSGRFLIIYTASNTIMLFGCAGYIVFTRNLNVTSDDVLILPQILAVIPGCFFALSRAILLPDLKPSCFPLKLWSIVRTVLSWFFAVIAYGSLLPAVFWSLLYKIADIAGEVLD